VTFVVLKTLIVINILKLIGYNTVQELKAMNMFIVCRMLDQFELELLSRPLLGTDLPPLHCCLHVDIPPRYSGTRQVPA